MSDTISDLLTRLRNAQNASKESVSVPFSKMKHSICQVLLNEGYVDKVDIDDNDKKNLNITLKYYEGKPVIKELKRVSRPGLREYVNHKDIPQVKGGLGVAIISTSKGLLTDAKAREAGLGGEVICSVF